MHLFSKLNIPYSFCNILQIYKYKFRYLQSSALSRNQEIVKQFFQIVKVCLSYKSIQNIANHLFEKYATTSVTIQTYIVNTFMSCQIGKPLKMSNSLNEKCSHITLFIHCPFGLL